MKKVFLFSLVFIFCLGLFANGVETSGETDKRVFNSIDDIFDVLAEDYNIKKDDISSEKDLLLISAIFAEKEMVQFLVDNGVLWFDDSPIYNSFVMAIVAGDLDLVNAFIDSGLDVNRPIFEEVNFLLLACALSDNVEIVKSLVSGGAFFYSNSLSSIGEMLGVKTTEYGVDYEYYLFSASLSGNSEILAYLFDVIKDEKYFEDELKNYFNSNKGVFDLEVFYNSLNYLPKKAFFVVVSYLLENNLFNIDILKSLIKSDKFSYFRDKEDNTLIHYLARYYGGDFSEVINLLVAENYNLDYKSIKGSTPILYSGINKFNPDRFKLFLEQGCDINVENEDGINLLEIVVFNNSFDNFLYVLNRIDKSIINIAMIVYGIKTNEEFVEDYAVLYDALLKKGFKEEELVDIKKLEEEAAAKKALENSEVENNSNLENNLDESEVSLPVEPSPKDNPTAIK